MASTNQHQHLTLTTSHQQSTTHHQLRTAALISGPKLAVYSYQIQKNAQIGVIQDPLIKFCIVYAVLMNARWSEFSQLQRVHNSPDQRWFLEKGYNPF